MRAHVHLHRSHSARSRFLIACIAGFTLSLVINASAWGQADKSKCPEQTSDGTNYEIVRGPDGKKIFRIKTGFCIEGKVPKPSVIYVLNASTINYEWENLKRGFLHKTLKSVERKPF